MSALLESLVYNRKRAAARSYNICRSRDIVSGSTAIEMNGYTCYSPHRVLFRASLVVRTRSVVSFSSSLLSLPFSSSPVPLRSRGDKPLTPFCLPASYRFYAFRKLKKQEERISRSGIVKIRRAATPVYCRKRSLARAREKEEGGRQKEREGGGRERERSGKIVDPKVIKTKLG